MHGSALALGHTGLLAVHFGKETVGLAGERIIIKADQEVAITDLQRTVARLRKDYGSALEQSRVGDSNSNGRG